MSRAGSGGGWHAGADPACKVMGGIAGGPETFTREVIEAGCLKHVDLFNLHIYPGQRTPESFGRDMDDLLCGWTPTGGASRSG